MSILCWFCSLVASSYISQNSTFCILFVRVWVCLVIVSTLALNIFWRQFLRFFYSSEPLCHKLCCQRFPFGISQSSVPPTNIQSVCFKKLYRTDKVRGKWFVKVCIELNLLKKTVVLRTSVIKSNQCSHLHKQTFFRKQNMFL